MKTKKNSSDQKTKPVADKYEEKSNDNDFTAEQLNAKTIVVKKAVNPSNILCEEIEQDLTRSYIDFSGKADIFATRFVAYNKYDQRLTEFAMDQSLLSLEPEVDLTKSVLSCKKLPF
ncbi:MAG: hypothetical protein HYX61_04355 [Gammaproteobacteria bacterium]|nr:hypothetical protein [Gammaproteobacteria bacterium]